jgi:hypothetical protein
MWFVEMVIAAGVVGNKQKECALTGGLEKKVTNNNNL